MFVLFCFIVIDKEKEIIESTLLIRTELQNEINIKNKLLIQIDELQKQLNESKQGLKAATRLQQQLDKLRHQSSIYQDQSKCCLLIIIIHLFNY